MQSGAGVAVHAIGWPATYGGIEVVWQLRQAMPACGPDPIAKQASCAAKRPGENRHGPWHPRHAVEKPAVAWFSACGSVAVRS